MFIEYNTAYDGRKEADFYENSKMLLFLEIWVEILLTNIYYMTYNITNQIILHLFIILYNQNSNVCLSRHYESEKKKEVIPWYSIQVLPFWMRLCWR